MRLFESIVDANHRALAGDSKAGVHVADFTESLPVVALTCIDPRLNRFFPGVLGLPEQEFIWLRNAGNIITSPLSSTMRSLALACAVKGGREIALIGHSDCRVRDTTISQLTDRLKVLGIDRAKLPENLTEYFGIFARERQNVIRGVDFIRHSPLIGPKIPVHGLLVDINTGKLEWLVNGYDALERAVPAPPSALQISQIGANVGEFPPLAGFNLGEMKFPEGKIGDTITEITPSATQTDPAPPVLPKFSPRQIPTPPVLRRAKKYSKPPLNLVLHSK